MILTGFTNPEILILLWIPGFLLLKPCISTIASTESIEVNPKTFHIRRFFCGIRVRHHQKSISVIDRIELDLSLEDESSITYAICQGEEKYPFGLALNRAEQLWLAREISNYLKQLKS